MNKPITLKLAWLEQPATRETWDKSPTYRTISARQVSTHFAIHREDGWDQCCVVTHIRSGFSAARTSTIAKARRIALALEAKYDFGFDDHRRALGMVGAKKLIAEINDGH